MNSNLGELRAVAVWLRTRGIEDELWKGLHFTTTTLGRSGPAQTQLRVLIPKSYTEIMR